MKRILVLIPAIFISLAIFSQKGKFYLTHYTPDSEQLTNENFSLIQDAKQQMLFANSKGVLKFDGKFWLLINTPSTALALSNYKDEEENYVGCLNDAGYINIDRNGIETYTSILSTKSKPSYFSKVVSNGNDVYFLGQDMLIQYSKIDKKIANKWDVSSGYEFSQLFTIGENVFAFDEQKGFFRFENGKLLKLKTDITGLANISFVVNADQNRALIGTNEGKLFFFNGLYTSELSFVNTQYLKNSVPFDAVLLNPNLLAIATSKGGVVLLNPTDGTEVSIVNFYSGLPDDEVYAIGKDNQSGLWIAHEFGLSRLDYFLPFRSFNVYPGLEGNITSSLTYKTKLYVGTNEGLFLLEKVTDFAVLAKELKKSKRFSDKNRKRDEKVGKSRDGADLISSFRNIFSFRKKEKKQKKEGVSNENPVESKTEKGFLGIFRRRQKQQPVVIDKPLQSDVKKPIKAKIAKKAVKTGNLSVKPLGNNENFEMQSINFAFQKIKGIEGKVRQLLVLNQKLLVATNNGLYEIDKATVKKISDAPVSHLCLSVDKSTLFAASDLKMIISFAVNGNLLTKRLQLSNFKEKISSIAEDHDGNIWVSFDNFIFKYSNRELNAVDTVLIENPFSEDINLILKDKKMHILLNSSAYYYDKNKKQLVVDTSFNASPSSFVKIIHSEANNLWYQLSNEWKLISNNNKVNPNFVYLSLIKDISQIYLDEDKKHIWISTKTNNLFQFDISDTAKAKFAQNIFLRSLNDKKGKPLDIRQIELNEESGNVSFSFVNPEYIDNQSLQYQYKLNGLNENWSEWTADNKINFSYLPSGNYELIVRTRNSMNQLRESTPLNFRVKPPYWKEWWFYLAELLFFGSLLVLSIWLNHVTHQKNEWISKGLTFLTIVMLIEFINTVFESYLKFADSPVLSFLVQVFLAILILPFERVLSKFITHDSKNTIAKVTRSRKSKTNQNDAIGGDNLSNNQANT
ncbi:MAG: two-component regulator propeller domain-containing protein [Cytophagales bacterium]